MVSLTVLHYEERFVIIFCDVRADQPEGLRVFCHGEENLTRDVLISLSDIGHWNTYATNQEN